MKWTTAISTALAAMAMAAFSGCDRPMPPPGTNQYNDWQRTLKCQDLDEVGKAQAMVDAKAAYDYRLGLLHDYYVRTGNYAKTKWAEGELANVRSANTFRYVDIKPATPAVGPSLDAVDEATLAELVIDGRNTWLTSVNDMREFYLTQPTPPVRRVGWTKVADDPKFRAEMMRSIQYRFDPVRKHEFFLDVELPPENLKAVDAIPAADTLFDKAYQKYTMAALSGPGL